VSKILNTVLSKGLFFDIGYMASTFGKKKGRGDDLFLLSLFITCLKVSRYPKLSFCYILHIN
jgi:hypothetical protein